jgi:hypothetical protein
VLRQEGPDGFAGVAAWDRRGAAGLQRRAGPEAVVVVAEEPVAALVVVRGAALEVAAGEASGPGLLARHWPDLRPGSHN